MDTPRVLVVDDDREIVKAIILLLKNEGIEAVGAYDGAEALKTLSERQDIRLIILDIMMPRLDGLSATLKIREKRNLPILLLSAKSEQSDKVLGLSMGADDYVCKPFHPPELIARVKSLLRRYTLLGGVHSRNEKTAVTGGLSYAFDERRLYLDGEPVRLTATETKLVELFMRNLGRVFSAEELYERVWDEPAYGVENTVMVHIRRIREKIEANTRDPKYIKVVWGIGYKMEKI